MNNKVFFGKNDLRYYYFRFRDSIYYSISLITLVVVVCLILVFAIILPQATKYFSIRNEVIAEREKIRIINDNTMFIKNINKADVANKLEIASRALPAKKDFGGILNAIADSSIKSGVAVEDFRFNVGEIASKSAGIEKNNNIPSPIGVDLLLRTDPSRVRFFINEINKKFPLAEVIEIESSSDVTILSLQFYYKPYPDVLLDENKRISGITNEQKLLIDELSTWDTSLVFSESDTPVSTTSGIPLFE